MYTITDVEELGGWIEAHFEGRKPLGRGGEEGVVVVEDAEGRGGAGVMGGRKGKGVEEMWERVSEEELERDPCVRVMREETEEGKKVSRNGGRKFVSVWRRREDPPWPDEIVVI